MKRVGIHSVPRSGSTWLGEIINSSKSVIYKYQPLFSYSFKNRLSESSSLDEINSFFEELPKVESNFLDKTESRIKGTAPSFQKDSEPTIIAYKEVRYHHILRNLLRKDREIEIIGLIRNPLSVINSWFKVPNEFKRHEGWNELEEWRWASKKNEGKIENFFGFEKWREVALLFEQLSVQYPNRFHLVRYDDLLNNTLLEVEKLFKALKIPIGKQTYDFIEKSSSISQEELPYSVYRKDQVDDKWKNQLPEEIVNAIQEELRDTILYKYLTPSYYM